MRRNNVLGEMGKGFFRPVFRFGILAAGGSFKCSDHCLDVNVLRRARVGKRFTAPTAVLDSELFEYAYG